MWSLLDQYQDPVLNVELMLYEKEGQFMIRANGWELMTTLAYYTEQEIVTAAFTGSEPFTGHCLVGGLGIGFTLQSVLKKSTPMAKVTVSELSPAVIHWAQTYWGHLIPGCLEDQRVNLQCIDVGEVIRRGRESYDRIILDVDNGPQALSANSNAWLYETDGLRQIRVALKKDGLVAFWSAFDSIEFEAALKQAGFAVSKQHVPVGIKQGLLHTFYLGRRILSSE